MRPQSSVVVLPCWQHPDGVVRFTNSPLHPRTASLFLQQPVYYGELARRLMNELNRSQRSSTGVLDRAVIQEVVPPSVAVRIASTLKLTIGPVVLCEARIQVACVAGRETGRSMASLQAPPVVMIDPLTYCKLHKFTSRHPRSSWNLVGLQLEYLGLDNLRRPLPDHESA